MHSAREEPGWNGVVWCFIYVFVGIDECETSCCGWARSHEVGVHKVEALI